jgi:hypothetical protein
MAGAISKFIKRVKCARETAAKEAAAREKEAAAKEAAAREKEAAAAAKEAAFASLTAGGAAAEKEAEDAKTQYMLDNAQDKGGLLDALMAIDWLRVDLKCIDALLSKHDVSFDDLEPVLKHHCEKLADVDIDKSCIKYNELTQCDINVPNDSLRALIFIIFRYEKQMHESGIISDLFLRLVANGGKREWLMPIFARLDDLTDERFTILCETKSLSELNQYKELHRIAIKKIHVISAIKNPDASVFISFAKICDVHPRWILDSFDRFNVKITIGYIVRYAPFNTFVQFTWRLNQFYFESSERFHSTCVELINSARFQQKYDIVAKIISIGIDERIGHKLIEFINIKTPIGNSHWIKLCTCVKLRNDNIMSVCCHNNIYDIRCILKSFNPSADLLKMLHADKYSQLCSVSENVYNNNKVLLYKEILGNSQYKIILDALHISILRELGDKALIRTVCHNVGINFMKSYDLKLLDLLACCGEKYQHVFLKNGTKEDFAELIQFVDRLGITKADLDLTKILNRPQIDELIQLVDRLGITKADLDIDALLKNVKINVANTIVNRLNIKKNDFDSLFLVTGYHDINTNEAILEFASLVKSLQIDKCDFAKFDSKRLNRRYSPEYVATVKSLLDLDADMCAKLLYSK